MSNHSSSIKKLVINPNDSDDEENLKETEKENVATIDSPHVSPIKPDESERNITINDEGITLNKNKEDKDKDQSDSEEYTNISLSSDDESDENDESSSVTDDENNNHPPTLTKENYNTIPNIEKLKIMSDKELSSVENFTVRNENVGSIMWIDKIDVRNLDLDKIIEIELNEYNKPYAQVSSDDVPQLNKPAIITLKQVNRPSDASVEEFTEKLKKKNIKNDSIFVNYNDKKKEWKFKVKHFSRYGLDDDDDDDDDELDSYNVNDKTNKINVSNTLEYHPKLPNISFERIDLKYSPCLQYYNEYSHNINGKSMNNKHSVTYYYKNRSTPITISADGRVISISKKIGLLNYYKIEPIESLLTVDQIDILLDELLNIVDVDSHYYFNNITKINEFVKKMCSFKIDFNRQRIIPAIFSLLNAIYIPRNDKSSISENKHEINIGSNDIQEMYYRSDMISKWFSSIIKTLNLFQPKNVYENILFHLLNYNIIEASEIAFNDRNFNLSLLISQLPNVERISDNIEEQIKIWDEYIISFDINLKNIYYLISGHPEKMNLPIKLPWICYVALHYWYSKKPFILKQAIHNYDNYHKTDIPPKPLYFNSERNDEDILYHLLNIYSNEEYSVDHILNNYCITQNKHDYIFTWILSYMLKVYGLPITDTGKSLIDLSFIQQLEELGKWEGCVFIAGFNENDEIRNRLISDILQKHLINLNDEKYLKLKENALSRLVDKSIVDVYLYKFLGC